jgi:hypothetical protein
VSRAAQRAFGSALFILAAVACGPRYATNGACTTDADCTTCAICSCERAYSIHDIDTATCTEVGKDVSCVPTPSNCIPASAQQALCVSGYCQVGNR